jgi:hypothetical protein
MVALCYGSRGGPICEFAKIREKSRIPQRAEDRGVTIHDLLSGSIPRTKRKTLNIHAAAQLAELRSQFSSRLH